MQQWPLDIQYLRKVIAMLLSITLPVALPPDTETMTIVSADRKALGGSMVISTGTCISVVLLGAPSVPSSPVLETCPKLNVKAAGKRGADFFFLNTHTHTTGILPTTGWVEDSVVCHTYHRQPDTQKEHSSFLVRPVWMLTPCLKGVSFGCLDPDLDYWWHGRVVYGNML